MIAPVGWIKLHRSTLDWEWYKDIPTKVLYLHLLMKANFAESRYQGEEVKRGSMIAGVNSLADQTGLSVSQVRTAIEKLKSTGEIAIKSTNKYSMITVVKYESFQDESQTDNKQIANESQTDRKRIANKSLHTKNIKKERSEEDQEGNKLYIIEFDKIWKQIKAINPEYNAKGSALKVFKKCFFAGISGEQILSYYRKRTQAVPGLAFFDRNINPYSIMDDLENPAAFTRPANPYAQKTAAEHNREMLAKFTNKTNDDEKEKEITILEMI